VTAELHARAKKVFHGAQGLSESARTPYLARVCAGDVALRHEVESLLAHHHASPLLTLRGPAHPDPLGVMGLCIEGRYRLERFVDEGGFGYVYRATHLLWQRPVAIKLSKRSLYVDDPELERSFIREGGLLNELSRRTTSIVQSYDVGLWRDSPEGPLLFTALEWLDGCTLADALRRERKRRVPNGWSLERVLTTLGPIAEALAVAHEHGIAHRDLKPGNVFLVSDGERTTPKLLDFGVAKVAAEHVEGFAATSARLGGFTARYAAPEQLARELGASGPWTDVYALALVCVELMLARHPLQHGSDLLTRTGEVSAEPAPGMLGLPVAPEVDAVFTRALAVRPERRFRDARTFWDALVAAHTAHAKSLFLCGL
jgi:serine/threonine protein kinase